MSRAPGPVILSEVGDEFVESANISAFLWEGATTAGDTCEVQERNTNNLIFFGRATGTQTWEGVVLSMSAPGGFRLTQLSAGRVLVYLAEPEAR